MFHLTLFSGTEGEMSPIGCTVLTVFGGAELRRPTLARQILTLRARPNAKRGLWRWLSGSDENLVVTIFGGTVVHEPTLVEEYAALSALVRSGQVAREELAMLLDRFGGDPRVTAYRSFTLFGACSSRRISAKHERKALDEAERMGAIGRPLRSALDGLVEAPSGVRWRALGELVTASPIA